MERTQIPKGDSETDKFFRFIFENAQGVVLNLDAAPSTAGGELEANQIGYYSNFLYWNVNGVVYKFAVTTT